MKEGYQDVGGGNISTDVKESGQKGRDGLFESEKRQDFSSL